MRRSTLRRKSPMKASKQGMKRAPVRPANRRRKASEWARAYGSRERVEFIRYLPCVVCGHTPCQNAHIQGGGASRKADATTVIPLCALHHGEQHIVGTDTFARRYNLDLPALAAETERAWTHPAAGGRLTP